MISIDIVNTIDIKILRYFLLPIFWLYISADVIYSHCLDYVMVAYLTLIHETYTEYDQIISHYYNSLPFSQFTMLVCIQFTPLGFPQGIRVFTWLVLIIPSSTIWRLSERKNSTKIAAYSLTSEIIHSIASDGWNIINLGISQCCIAIIILSHLELNLSELGIKTNLQSCSLCQYIFIPLQYMQVTLNY